MSDTKRYPARMHEAPRAFNRGVQNHIRGVHMLKLMQGDCLELMQDIPDKSVDLILTDPPYNVSQNNNFKTMGRHGLDFGEWDKEFDQEKWLHEINRLLKPNGSIIVFNTYQNLTLIQNVLEQYGLIYKDFIVIKKRNPMPRNRDRRYINSCEYALWMTYKKQKWIFNRQNGTYDSNIIECNVVAGKEKVGHPTQKPLSVINDLVLRHTNEGDTVLDPFMGSGTTAIACINTNRNFIGIELDAGYFKIAEKRIADAQNKPEQLFLIANK